MIKMTSWDNMTSILSKIKRPCIGSGDNTDLIAFTDTITKVCNLKSLVEQLIGILSSWLDSHRRLFLDVQFRR